MISSKQLALSFMLIAVAAVSIGTIATQSAVADDKRVRIDLNIKVQNMKGDKGDPGKDSTVPGPTGAAGADSTVPGPIGPQGPKGDSGNVTVNVCQQGTSNCVSENVGPNSTLTIFVNATGSVVAGNTTVPVDNNGTGTGTNETQPVQCQPGTHDENGTCVVDAVIPPIDNGTTVFDNGTVVNENGTSVDTNDTG